MQSTISPCPQTLIRGKACPSHAGDVVEHPAKKPAPQQVSDQVRNHDKTTSFFFWFSANIQRQENKKQLTIEGLLLKCFAW